MRRYGHLLATLLVMRIGIARHILFASISLSTIFHLGCMSYGPVSVQNDRFNYNQAYANSTREQMLLNIVRLRYGDVPYFLEVGSMLSQYELDLGGRFSRMENNLDVFNSPILRGIYRVDGDPSRETTYGANVNYRDRPTITYTPLQGEDYAARVMSPIPPETVIFLTQSGWGISRLLACCVQGINGIQNLPVYELAPMEGFNAKKYGKIVRLMQKLQDKGALSLGVEYAVDQKETYLYLPESEDPEVAEIRDELAELLEINLSDTRKLRLSYGVGVHEGDEIVMETRSLLGAMLGAAQGFKPPELHQLSGEVLQYADPQAFLEEIRISLIDIKSSLIKPPNAYVSVFYNGVWFYISKDDLSSKRTLALLSYLFSLQSSSRREGLPIVTVQAGG